MTNEGERLAILETKVQTQAEEIEKVDARHTKRLDGQDRKVWVAVFAVLGVVLKYVSDAVKAGAGQ